MSSTLLWFRQDLRLEDNPALQAAVARGGEIVPVFIFDEAGEWGRAPGAASRWWQHHSLSALDAALRSRGSRLVIARGDSEKILRDLLRETGASALHWNRRYEVSAIARDGWLETELRAAGVEVRTFNSALLHEPHAIANRQGRPFQVFSPYWRHCLAQNVAAPVKLGTQMLVAPATWPPSLAVDDLGLLPRIRWDADFYSAWQPGEAGAAKRLRRFVAHALERYAEERDFPGLDGTSQLSPHLHFGEIGPRQIWAAIRTLARSTGVFPPGQGAATFLNELGWREFAHHLLFHFHRTIAHPLREEFERFPWAEDPGGARLVAWQQGRTGYPIVDAGMRQLWHMGWMHNRVRMIAASFLVKHLRLPWTQGAAWFWDTLVDANLANNTLGWQWSAGCGADASPYFRIFAPVLQGRKFDPEGDYVRRWVPELARVPAAHVHAPWEAPADVLRQAGVTLGENYPA
ncbi:MAG TPA: deoxyribodipyrimidine photo-lyase, partial [Opitutaceae bacterium]|nr:deoxyribodipyrimidine photo-lyase [Opitutaceae bacterium]